MHPFFAVRKDNRRERIYVLTIDNGNVVFVPLFINNRVFDNMPFEELKEKFDFLANDVV